MPCSGPDLLGQLGSSVICHTWQNSPAQLFTFLARRMWFLMFSPDLIQLRFLLRSLPYFQLLAEFQRSLFLTMGRVPETSALFKTMGRATALALVLTMDGVPLAEPVFPGFDVTSLSRLQESCSSVQEMRTNPSLSVISNPLKTGNILCDISTGSLSPLVPLQVQCQLFNQFHILSHPGVRASRKLIFARFVWLGMSRDVGLSCLPCQRSKMSTHVHSPVPSFQVPTWRFSHVYIDIVKPLPYFLTMMDKTTRGCSLVLHLCRVLCMCIYLDIDLQVWSSSSSHIRPRLSVHPCNLDWSVICFGDFNLHYNLLSSSK